MECLLLREYACKHPSQNQGVISLSSQGKIEDILTFENILKIGAEIRFFLKSSIDNSSDCVGLVMNKNVLIPSMIIALQELNLSFTFLTSSSRLTNVRINWILSMDKSLNNKEYKLYSSIKIFNEKCLYLWINISDFKCNDFKDTFCILQTSGSTGENKTVFIPYNCIQSNVLSLNNHMHISSKDVIYWGTPLTFDPSLVEILLSLTFGAVLCIVPKSIFLNPPLLYKFLFIYSAVTFIQMVPSIFLRWNKQEISKIFQKSSLRILALGGEVFPKDILFYEKSSQLKIFNLYGVTELSCWATIEDQFDHGISLGTPLGDVKINLVENEIYLNSDSRWCYVNNCENLKMPFQVKTGDLGKFEGGKLYFIGRKSRLVKRYGQKINLYKLENLIYQEISLKSRLVFLEENNKVLAFILIEEYKEDHIKIRIVDKIRTKILNILPETAFPDFFHILKNFPLNDHGKIDDKYLIQLYEDSNGINKANARIEEIFLNLLSEYLKRDFKNSLLALGKYTFNELGGTSMLVVQFLNAFEDEIGSKVSEKFITILLNDNLRTCLDFVRRNDVANANVAVERNLMDHVKNSRTNQEAQINILWKYDLKGCVDAAPLVFNFKGETHICCGSFAQKFVILTTSGAEYFSFNLPKSVTASATVSKCGNFLYFGCSDGRLYCVNILLKDISWFYQTDDEIRCTALIINSCIVFGSYDEHVYCINLTDGSIKWKTKLYGNIKADSLYKNSKIYVATTRGMVFALNEIDGQIIWSVNLKTPIFSTPCILNDGLIVASVTGQLSFIKFTSEVKSVSNINGQIFSAIKCMERNGYFGCLNGFLYGINSEEVFEIVNLDSEISSSPFLFKINDKITAVSICNKGILHIIDITNRLIITTIRLPAQSFSSPYCYDNKVYFGCRDNYLYCIEM